MVTSQLHTFEDASEEAFSGVVYLRSEQRDRHIQTCLLMSKTKLAPIKTLSVAEQDLQVALMGSRLATYIQGAVSHPISTRYFWTDNSCIRNWVCSSSAAYKTFVSHRIGEIQGATVPKVWRYVPGSLNSSNIATRSSLASTDIPSSWFTGPAFLQLPEDRWPKDLPWMKPAEELRPCHTARVLRLQKQVAESDWSLVAIDPKDVPSYTRMSYQLLGWVKECQLCCFERELESLHFNGRVK